MDEPLREYRQYLLLAEQKAQDAYDKTILSLSGGALGISFAFIDKFLTGHSVAHPSCLVSSWAVWASSVALILTSHLFSGQSLRRAIKQTDANQIYKQTPGGGWARLTAFCNIAAGITFLAGVVLMILFVYANIGAISNG